METINVPEEMTVRELLLVAAAYLAKASDKAQPIAKNFAADIDAKTEEVGDLIDGMVDQVHDEALDDGDACDGCVYKIEISEDHPCGDGSVTEDLRSCFLEEPTYAHIENKMYGKYHLCPVVEKLI